MTEAADLRPRMRRRLYLTIGVLLAAGFCVVAIWMLLGAREKRAAEVERLIASANALSEVLDREVAGARALLLGLSTSPALKLDDLRQFHDQLKETRLPDGSWLVLSDRKQQLVHSLYPMGSELPRLSLFKPQPAFFERLEERTFSLTGRVRGLMIDTVAVTANYKIPGADGRLKYFITTVISDKRFGSILSGQRPAEHISSAIFDHRLTGIAQLSADALTVAPGTPPELAADLAKEKQKREAYGVIETVDDLGVPLVMAYVRSDYTEWTAVSAIPRAFLDEPVRATLQTLAISAAIIAATGLLLLNYLRRNMEEPLEILEMTASSAEKAVSVLNSKMLSLQEDEHKRIADDLHDATTQHLAGATLELLSLDARLAVDPTARRTAERARHAIDEALNELRTFSYLLRPKDLEDHRLAATLTSFVRGFFERAHLKGEISIDPEVDSYPFDLQLSLLRITQEALANVHRHAAATWVSVRITQSDRRITLTVSDNGKGIADRHAAQSGLNGVGFSSMRQRLLPFEGQLEIASSAGGTTVRATIPKSDGFM